VTFEGVGHLPYEEAPDEFNRALIDFLRDANVGPLDNASAKFGKE
jgi:hypothetical protein